jgi:hypothetical protein
MINYQLLNKGPIQTVGLWTHNLKLSSARQWMTTISRPGTDGPYSRRGFCRESSSGHPATMLIDY